MAERSIADQELFLPTENQNTGQQPAQSAANSQPRYYESLNNSTDEAHNDQSGVPAVNVIPATPSTTRSSTIRSNMSQGTEPKVMAGALPEVTEEDDLYGASSSAPNYPPVPQQTTYHEPHGASGAPQEPYQSSQPPNTAHEHSHAGPVPSEPTGHAPSAPYESGYGAPESPYPTGGYGHPSANEAPQPSADHGYSNYYGVSDPPPHPPTYEEDRASRTGEEFEQPPAQSGPPPPVPSKFHEEVASSSVHPSVHLQSDQDYALALSLQDEVDEQPPPLPQRPAQSAAADVERSAALSSHAMTPEEQDHAFAMRLQEEEDANAPALPIRPGQQSSSLAPDRPKAFTRTPSTDQFLPPPRREATDFGRDDPSDPIHYTRDPHKLIAYLVPFPTPKLTKAPSDAVPKRFLIYTPPPPPLQAPPEGVKEDRTHKVQRKWQDEVRKAKLSEAKTTSWAGFRAKLTRGVSKAMTYTTTSNVDFLSRVTPSTSPPNSRPQSQGPKGEKGEFEDMYDEDPAHQSHETKKTVEVEEMVFVYSPSMNLTPDAMRAEFINTVLRTKSKAMRDSVIATGLLPVSLAVDIVLIAVSGLFEVNAAWAYFNIKGAKTARSVSKRLSSSTAAANTVDPEKPEAEMQKEDKLKLDFKPATRIDVLTRYLEAECHRVDPQYFPDYRAPPTESDCLEAIGWSPHQTGGQKNWEDEAWELNEVKEDLRVVMRKAAKEWRSYCHGFEKNPEKNLNK